MNKTFYLNEIKDGNEIEDLSLGQKVADLVAKHMGSWKFIIIQSIILMIWILLNIFAYIDHWDPYPFILMNLVLSLQAAYTAPIIMMSQNRLNERDRRVIQNDYFLDKKAEQNIRAILKQLNKQNEILEIIKEKLDS